jgi:hypothetical protein
MNISMVQVARMMPLGALCALLVGCGMARDISEHGALAATSQGITATYEMLKQGDDYLRMVVRLRNDSNQSVRFASITDKTVEWGFALTLPPSAVAAKSGTAESGIIIPAHGTTAVDLFWLVFPEQPTIDWPWTCTISGLTRDGQPLSDIVLTVPPFPTGYAR